MAKKAVQAPQPRAGEVPKRTVRRIEDPFAPEIFVTQAPDLWRFGDNVHVTFTTGRYTHGEPQGADAVVVGRVVMPIAVAQGLALSLYSWLDRLGLRPGGMPKKEDVQ